jgi:hypothetical protein
MIPTRLRLCSVMSLALYSEQSCRPEILWAVVNSPAKLPIRWLEMA